MGLFALGAWQACGMVFHALLQRACGPHWRALHVQLPRGVGVVPVTGLLAGAAGGALCATWALFHNEPWTWPLQVGAALLRRMLVSGPACWRGRGGRRRVLQGPSLASHRHPCPRRLALLLSPLCLVCRTPWASASCWLF